ncbi:lipopolysaccharide heptosyltransferase II [bacterium]|nr:lipopolysaccharide heptosyltransferase II [bacterium]
MKENKFKKILIIQTGFIGDVVLTIPLIETIKKNYPQSFLCAVTLKNGKDILLYNPYLDEIIIYEKKSRDKGLINFINLVKKIRRKRFNLAILPHKSLRSVLIAVFSGIKERVGLKKYLAYLFYSKKIPLIKEDQAIERNLRLASALNCALIEKNPHLYLSAKDNEYTDKFLRINSHDYLVGINPGAAWKTKRWVKEGFAEVGNILAKEGKVKIIFFGGPNETSLVKEIMELINFKPIIATGKTTVRQMISLISKCKLYIGNDSGPTHIAASLGIPTVVIFGPTVLEQGFTPRGDKVVILENKSLKCRPCGGHGPDRCKYDTLACMKSISAEEVIRSCKEVIKW